MTSYIITLKDDTTKDEVEAAKQQAIDQGGKIIQSWMLIKGFAVEMDDDAVTTLESNPHILTIEKDSLVCTC
ncbi:hypothetical protein E4U42_004236 [Claviceps africana]|uniref:Inhibitor I9 domain-containing protein n=1 Tax=Claviceps africana TaxID=83212 RepID=A0A8K0J8A6_9HYPO|nr:hypothetical protein E4U42_004236 [Claviceps africana]